VTTVPDVTGQSLTFPDAAAALAEAGFTDVVVSDDSDSDCEEPAAPGCVVTGQDPAGGTEVEDPAATRVSLVLEADENNTAAGLPGSGAGGVGGEVLVLALAPLGLAVRRRAPLGR
jgi:hypothetical protein